MARKKHIAFLIIIFCFVFGSLYAKAQSDSLLDSLENINDHERVDLLNELSEKYRNLDLFKSLSYGKMALGLADELDYTKGKEQAYSSLGITSYVLGEYDEALEYLQLAVIESLYRYDKKREGDNYIDIARVYLKLEDYGKTMQYVDDAILIYKELDDKEGLANAYNLHGNVYEKKGMPNSAIIKYNNSLEIFRGIVNQSGIAHTLNNIGVVYYSEKEYKKALESFTKAYELFTKIDIKEGIAETKKNMGMVYAQMGKFNLAIESLLKSLEMAREYNLKSLISTIYSELSQTYSLQNNYKKALEYHEKYYKTRDSLVNQKTSTRIAELEVKYENVRKEKEQELSESEKIIFYNRVIIIVIVVIFVLVFIITFTKRYQENKRLTDIMNENFRQISVQKMKLNETLNILQESEEKFRAIFENSPIGIALYDNDGIVKASNANHDNIIGIAKQHMIGYNIFNNLNDDKMRTMLKDALRGDHTSYEGTYVSINGNLTYIKADFAPVYNKEGEMRGAIAIVEDISDRKLQEFAIKRSEHKLRELNATKDKFFSIIAHDLKNPLSIILNMSENLVTKFERFTDKQKFERANLVYDSSKTLFRLLENLLEWSRSQTGRIEYDPMEVDLFELAELNIELFKEHASAKNITLINNIEFETYCYVDKNMINTVVRNLISNAIKFTPNNGKVSIAANKNSSHIEVFVKDTGIGIEPQNIPKLFRLDISHSTSGTANEEGTGLGLVLCKEFIEKNKGSIKIESNNGQGTTFAFTVPKFQTNNK